jgi:hypothetical protein
MHGLRQLSKEIVIYKLTTVLSLIKLKATYTARIPAGTASRKMDLF